MLVSYTGKTFQKRILSSSGASMTVSAILRTSVEVREASKQAGRLAGFPIDGNFSKLAESPSWLG